jgi:hypothetical protein
MVLTLVSLCVPADIVSDSTRRIRYKKAAQFRNIQLIIALILSYMKTAEIIEEIHAEHLRKCDHCGIPITDLEDMVEEDPWVYCSLSCANALQ